MLADLVLFGAALKFREHWLAAGCLFPEASIGPFLRGEIDVMTATAQCFMPPGVPWLGNVTAALGRIVGVFDMQHEVTDVVEKWRDFLAAAARPECNA